MSNIMGVASKYGLENHGLRNLGMEHWTLTTPALLEQIMRRREAALGQGGVVIVRTGSHTGRSPNDKFIVKEGEAAESVWWGKTNRAISEEHFNNVYNRMMAYFQGRDVFVQDAIAGNHPEYQLPIRVVTENAWHSLFARNLFLRQDKDKLPDHMPEFTIIQAPGFRANPEVDGTNSEVFIIINFGKRLVLIGGTSYAGEIKKSVFTILNYLLPKKCVLPMHCSANKGQEGDVALFFGLSGTGKTTISSDPERPLIGDDEHGWGDDGVFNFEGGCYAKTIRLSEELEHLIYRASSQFGTILENVAYDPESRWVDYDDDALTENTRSAYPICFLENSLQEGRAGHPNNIVFLTADASGVLPPISRLTREQAMYHFISGYTSKLAGTEKGLGKEPQTTFSACFGAPFLPMHPTVYADMLGKKIKEHDAKVWLVNTGWTGGPFGVGKRISLPYTRALVRAALKGELDNVSYATDPFFGLAVPESAPGVPSEILNPRNTWDDKEAYDEQAQKLKTRFEENYAQYVKDPQQEVAKAIS
jgi:phosphoenolpyruvate carboxykinase (ATP)